MRPLIVLNVILFSSITILLFNFIMKRNKLLYQLGINFVFGIMLFTMIRMFILVDLPTHINIYMPRDFSTTFNEFMKRSITLGNIRITLVSMVGFVLILGSVFTLFKLILTYFRIRANILLLEPVDDFLIKEVVDQIKVERNIKQTIKLVYCKGISSPAIWGIHTPVILLPEKSLPQDMWYYILSHELSHYTLKDFFIKLLVEIVVALYWWNPLIYILRRNIINLQEIRADLKVVTSFTTFRKFDYLECLIHTAQSKPNIKFIVPWIFTFAVSTNQSITDRADILLKNIKKECKHSITRYLLGLLLVVSIVVFPDFFIIESSGIAPEHERGTYDFTEEDVYLLL